MFMGQFEGGQDAPIHTITELTQQERGESVRMQLVSDLLGDGVSGDSEREGRGEKLQNWYQDITIDLISHSVENVGKLSDQKSVIDFRTQANDKLKYWLANRIDQLKILTLSGIQYSYNLDGSPRTDSTFSNLAFASTVTAPTVGRFFRATANASGVFTGLQAGATTSVAATDVLTYKAIVDAMTKCRRNYLPGMLKNGKDYYVLLVSPEGYAQLKKDADFQNAIVNAGTRGTDQNEWFTGGIYTIDGIVVKESRLIFNTLGAASGSKWGGSGTVDGSRALILGRQALGYVDLAPPSWVEKKFDYESKVGINVDKLLGLVKPRFYNIYTKRIEDFGVAVLDHAI